MMSESKGKTGTPRRLNSRSQKNRMLMYYRKTKSPLVKRSQCTKYMHAKFKLSLWEFTTLLGGFQSWYDEFSLIPKLQSTICNPNLIFIFLTYNGKYYEGICYNLSLDSSNHDQVKSGKNRKISGLKDRVTICAIWDLVEKQQLIRKHLLLRSVDI